MIARKLISLCLLLWAGPVVAQDAVRQAFEQYSQKAFQEKVYLHSDRSFYVVGETLWFKLYVVDGTTHQPADLSKVAYLELLDASHTPVLQSKVSLEKGKGHGMLILPATLNSGRYHVRAYTNWMKNFSADLYYEKTLTIVNSFTKVPTQEKEAQLDLQFFPEGGHLVESLPGRVAFRGINENGFGSTFSGTIRNAADETVATFQSEHLGMGSFVLTPKAGETYRAVVKDAAGTQRTYTLPDVQKSGYVLTLQDTGKDELEVRVAGPDARVSLLVHTRQSVQQSESNVIRQGKTQFWVKKSDLLEGITHLTLFNAEQQPLCERLYFKRPERPAMKIGVKSDKAAYARREKISLALQLPDSADVSVTVYRLDSLQNEASEDIYSYLWLNSDLKGTVEAPATYLTDSTANVDLVMLTHGWSRFPWEQVMHPVPFRYIPEYEAHLLYGKVMAHQQPVANVPVYLAAPGKDVWLYPALSDRDGRVFFQMKHFEAMNEVVVQTEDTLKRVELESPFSDQFSSRTLPVFSFDRTLKNALLDRSIQMQVRNAYQPLYQSVPVSDTMAFYGIPEKSYKLDDYTRFPVLEEVMREYVPEVDVRRHQGQFSFLMLGRAEYSFTQPPLVLVDGVPVFDVNKVLALDPLKIKRLDVVNRRYFLGPLLFEGIVSFRSYKGDLAGFQPEGLITSYEGVQAQRTFYSPRYDTPQQRQSRTADFRTLLYWAPQVKATQALDFYTSDLSGTYQVVIQGLSAQGDAGSQRMTFEVGK
ncbi:hypothetical protein BWI97_17345 [Siphonobacter sp. BAB-5405]|uniref:hypothetical protein n=1 Tax=Siphonobacter sp. BAB-5405 TaxID=1864825 RepID=UPI000C80FA19|nr:hypothetical protein [Siphonobacter sp. BAB-5405]PMD94031.1 hypothetical protein BWI97_17345 [Siphonobacter sp. BAB-5405]